MLTSCQVFRFEKELELNKELQEALELCRDIKQICDENYYLLEFRRKYVRMKNPRIEDKIKLIEDFELGYEEGLDLMEFADELKRVSERYFRKNNLRFEI